MSKTLLQQESIIRRFIAYCAEAISNAEKDAYKFLKRNSRDLISIFDLPHETASPYTWDAGVGTQFSVQGQNICITDDDLADALKLLPDESREIILRYYMLRQTETQIALYLYKNQRTISYKKNKALKMIRKWMEK